MDQLVHLEGQRPVTVRVLADQKDDVHERDSLVFVGAQEVVQSDLGRLSDVGLVVAGHERVLNCYLAFLRQVW